MNILSAIQIKQLDQYTILHEPIVSVDLMERAAKAFVHTFTRYVHLRDHKTIYVCCGSGNNGGDGLAIARLLQAVGFHVSVYILASAELSGDCAINEKRLPRTIEKHFVETADDFPPLDTHDIVIDGLFGTGLNRPVEGLAANLVHYINASEPRVFSIDIPSGMYADGHNQPGDPVVKAAYTFTFHAPKLSFFLPSYGDKAGDVTVLDIGLSKDGEDALETLYHCITETEIRASLLRKPKFGYKNTFGHVCLCAGSSGMAGAAVLSVKATLRSGVGLVSTQVPSSIVSVMQTQNPEAICLTDTHDNVLTAVLDYTPFSALGTGPGIGTDDATKAWLLQVLKQYTKPMVLDADALNIIAADESLWQHIPVNSILTPHIGEFNRLFGKSADDLERLDIVRTQAQKHKVIIVLKGAHTAIALPDGNVIFNTTGNPGMAKGGSGDVLTGILTGLLGQGYEPATAAMLGVYLHGLAGDIAADICTEYSMTALDIIEALGKAYKQLQIVD